MSNIQVVLPGEKPGPDYHIRVLPVQRTHSFQITVAYGNWAGVKRIWDELYDSKLDPNTKAPVEMGWLFRGGKFNAAMDSCDGGELVAKFNQQEGLITIFNPEPEIAEDKAPEIEEPESITFATSITGGEPVLSQPSEKPQSIESGWKIGEIVDDSEQVILSGDEDESSDSEPN